MTKKRKTVWTPYNPDDCIGDFGWLWLDGPMGHEWVLVYTGTDDPDCPEGVLLDLIGRQDDYGACESSPAMRFAGTPYLSISQPTAKPGHSDALEVSVRGQGGFYTAMAFGDSTDAAETQAKVFAALGLLGGEDGQT